MTNALQDVALVMEPGGDDVLKRRPRPVGEGIMSRVLVERAVLVSLVIAAGGVLNFLYLRSQGRSLEECRTVAMSTMVFFQAWNSRWEARSILTMHPFSNPYPLGSLVLATLAQVAVIHAGFLRRVFRTAPLTLAEGAGSSSFRPLWLWRSRWTSSCGAPWADGSAPDAPQG